MERERGRGREGEREKEREREWGQLLYIQLVYLILFTCIDVNIDDTS